MENEPPTAPLQTEPEPPVTNPDTSATNAFPSETQPVTPATSEKKPNNLLKIIIPFIVIIVVGLVLFLTIGQKTNPSPNPTTPDNPANSSDTPDIKDEEISVEWFDGTEPGNTHTAKINRKTGKFSYTNAPGCSTVECLNGDEWPDSVEKTGTFLPDDLEKVLKVYDSLDFDNEDADYLKKIFWFRAISSIADGDDIVMYTCVEETNPDDIELCNQTDLNSDGIITSRESGLYTINYLIDEMNQ